MRGYLCRKSESQSHNGPLSPSWILSPCKWGAAGKTSHTLWGTLDFHWWRGFFCCFFSFLLAPVEFIKAFRPNWRCFQSAITANCAQLFLVVRSQWFGSQSSPGNCLLLCNVDWPRHWLDKKESLDQSFQRLQSQIWASSLLQFSWAGSRCRFPSHHDYPSARDLLQIGSFGDFFFYTQGYLAVTQPAGWTVSIVMVVFNAKKEVSVD